MPFKSRPQLGCSRIEAEGFANPVDPDATDRAPRHILMHALRRPGSEQSPWRFTPQESVYTGQFVKIGEETGAARED
jgi:hypothetical protein